MKNKFEYAIAELSNLKPKILRDKKFPKSETWTMSLLKNTNKTLKKI